MNSKQKVTTALIEEAGVDGSLRVASTILSCVYEGMGLKDITDNMEAIKFSCEKAKEEDDGKR